ncbi:MAG: AMP-binding protein [Sedimentisphaerales bacterium]|nr:AMP-binding protein [Sedimentisphaerales bacterium]
MIEFDPVLVHEWLSRSARRFPDKCALVCSEQRWTYRMLDSYTDRLARVLLSAGLESQERVLIFLDSSAEAVISLYGVLKARGVFVMLDGSTKAPRLQYVLDNSGATMIITHTSKADVVQNALAGVDPACRIVWVGPSDDVPSNLQEVSLAWDEVLESSADLSSLPRCIDVDIASLIYTSATTGDPKGIICTHHNMVSAARSIIQYIGNEESDVILDVLPLSFDYGLYQVLMAFMFGGTVVLERSFLYIHKVLELIRKEGVTGFPIVPTIIAMLMKSVRLEEYDLHTLRYMTNTGAALPETHIRYLRTSLPRVTLFSMFGLSECKRVSYLPPEHIDRIPGSVGQAIPNCEVSVVDASGRPVALGEVGELVVRGSNVMQGYWRDPETTARTYHPGCYPADRRLYCGDYFRQDEQGFLYFLGRKDGMIKSGGHRISPKEVENVLCGLAGVAEAAVIGVDDEILGQAIKAFVVPLEGISLSEMDVLRYCRENLELPMVPRYVELVASLPKTTNGKINMRELRAREMQIK